MIWEQVFGIAYGGDEIAAQPNQRHAQAAENHQQAHPRAGAGANQPAKGAGEQCLWLRMAGSSTKSARVPPMMGEMGLVNQAIRRRAEKTRPCRSGATLDCQMAWLEPLISGDRPARPAAIPASQAGRPNFSPRIAIPTRPGVQPAAQHAVDPALEAAPGAHHNPADDRAKRAGRFHRAENQAVLIGASQHHRRQDGIGDARKQVAKEEDQLQAEQAGPGKNVAEAVGGFFEHAALGLFAFFGLARLRE